MHMSNLRGAEPVLIKPPPQGGRADVTKKEGYGGIGQLTARRTEYQRVASDVKSGRRSAMHRQDFILQALLRGTAAKRAHGNPPRQRSL